MCTTIGRSKLEEILDCGTTSDRGGRGGLGSGFGTSDDGIDESNGLFPVFFLEYTCRGFVSSLHFLDQERLNLPYLLHMVSLK